MTEPEFDKLYPDISSSLKQSERDGKMIYAYNARDQKFYVKIGDVRIAMIYVIPKTDKYQWMIMHSKYTDNLTDRSIDTDGLCISLEEAVLSVRDSFYKLRRLENML